MHRPPSFGPCPRLWIMLGLSLVGCPSGDDGAPASGGSTGATGEASSGGDPAETGTSTETTIASDDAVDTTAGSTGESLPVSTPRHIAPLSGSTVTSRTPLLELELEPGTEGVRVELCADRGCETVIADFEFDGPSGVPAAELAAGRVYWRAFGRTAGEESEAPTTTWELWVPNKASARIDSWYGVSRDFNGDGYDDYLSRHGRIAVGLGGPEGITAVIDLDALPVSDDRDPRPVGDVNGDGFADIGIPAANYGSVVILYGGPEGPSVDETTILDGSDQAFQFGTSVVSAGDVDRDGYGDVAVGTGDVGVADDAFVWVFPGGPQGVTFDPLVKIHESMPDCDPGCGSWGFGQYPMGCDINGDRRVDIIASGRSGMYVFEATATGFTSLPTIIDHGYGDSIDCGDVDGDGHGDLVVGAVRAGDPHNDEIRVYFGGPRGLSSDASTSFHVLPEANDNWSAQLSVLGDVDGDGLDDIGTAPDDATAVVIPGAEGGPTEILTLPLANPRSIRAHGDLDGDGLRDFSVAAGPSECDEWLFAGSTDLPFPLLGGWATYDPGPCDPR